MYQVKDIKLAEIRTSELNPRKSFDQNAIEELAQSIKENGLIQPVTLRKVKADNGIKYEVVCGERRFRAVTFLGQETIQATVKELTDTQAFSCMVIENLQRKDIDPMEEAAAIRHLYKDCNVTVKEISKILGKSPGYVTSRIQLNNIIPEFEELMRKGTLNLTHLYEIAKLTKEQQVALLQGCFQEVQMERWTFKILTMERLKEWIDEYVMCHISSAKFDPADDTYNTCKACVGCKFNTASRPTSYSDENNPRCMKMEWFKAKNQEAVLREAKVLGLPVVYVGTPKENEDILKMSQEMSVFPQPLGKREYLVYPTPPTDEGDPKDSKYQKRLANFERVKAVFDENLEAGIVMKVFEISFSGIVSGEVKYLLNMQSEEVAMVDEGVKINAEKLSMYKTELRAVEEVKGSERIERQRSFMEGASYSAAKEKWDETEENVFLALLASRLTADFRNKVGLGNESAMDVSTSFQKLNENKHSIMREFMRTLLSDKSVSYSPMFASLLDMTMKHRFEKDVEQIELKLTEDFAKKTQEYKDRIAELELQLRVQSENDENIDDVPQNQETENKEESAPSENAEQSNVESAPTEETSAEQSQEVPEDQKEVAVA